MRSRISAGAEDCPNAGDTIRGWRFVYLIIRIELVEITVSILCEIYLLIDDFDTRRLHLVHFLFKLLHHQVF